MNLPFSPRQILCINLSVVQLPFFMNRGFQNPKTLMQLIFKPTLEEARSAMKSAAFDALIVGSSDKNPLLWQELQAFHNQSPYFPILLLSESLNTDLPFDTRELNFPSLTLTEDASFDHLLLEISQSILQAKIQYHDQQQYDQWEMLDQLENLPFKSEGEFIQIALEQCQKLTQSEMAAVIQLNDNLEINNWICTHGEDAAASLRQNSLLEGWIHAALKNKTPQLFTPPDPSGTTDDIFRCLLYPVRKHDRLHCLLVFINKATPYHDRDVLYIKQSSSKIWGLINLKQNESLLYQQLQDLETLNSISSKLRLAISSGEFLESFLDETLSLLHSEVGAILLYDNQTKRMFSATAKGWIKSIHDVQVHIDYGISGRVYRSKLPIITDEFKSHPDLHPSAKHYFTEGWGGACYPILSAAKVIGVLFLCVPLPRTLSQYEIWLLSTLIEFAGNTLQRLEVSSDLEKTKSNLAWDDEQLVQLMETLNKDRELLNITLMEIGEGVIRLNELDEITLINHEAEIITGYTGQEMMGHPIEEVFKLIDPKTNQPIQDVLHHLNALDQMEKNGMFHHPPMLLNKFSRKILITGNLSPIYTSEGRKIGSVLVMKDITERLELESQMALLKKMEAIGQMATGIAHEINTPIQYINENLQYIQRGFAQIHHLIQQGEKYLNQVPMDQKEKFLSPVELETLREVNQLLENRNTRHYLDEIPAAIQESLEGIERVRKIILAIREFSHPSDSEKKPSPINHAIHNLVTISKNEWKNIAEMQLELEPDLPLVSCRIDEINQALLNMIINAAQAIDSNPTRPKTKKGLIRIKTWHSSTMVFISIEDTGCGIEENALDRIFDPFFTTKDIGQGTGQGLFIAHTIIVKKHLGMINVKTKPNEGTIFTIQIPINSESALVIERKD